MVATTMWGAGHSLRLYRNLGFINHFIEIFENVNEMDVLATLGLFLFFFSPYIYLVHLSQECRLEILSCGENVTYMLVHETTGLTYYTST